MIQDLISKLNSIDSQLLGLVGIAFHLLLTFVLGIVLHMTIRFHKLITIGVALLTTVISNLIQYLLSGYLHKFFPIAVFFTFLYALPISYVAGLPFRRIRNLRESKEEIRINMKGLGSIVKSDLEYLQVRFSNNESRNEDDK